MIKKRSKFWTIVFSFLPGVGHMYNGFMKLGVSFMGMFFAVWAIASFINIGALTFITPVIWFYAFFDCINRTFQEDEDFYTQEDHYLFTMDQITNMNFDIIKRRSLVIGVALVIVGIYALWNNVVMGLITQYNILPQQAYAVLYDISHILPQLVVGILIIWAGVSLIKGKKEQMEEREEVTENDR